MWRAEDVEAVGELSALLTSRKEKVQHRHNTSTRDAFELPDSMRGDRLVNHSQRFTREAWTYCELYCVAFDSHGRRRRTAELESEQTRCLQAEKYTLTVQYLAYAKRTVITT